MRLLPLSTFVLFLVSYTLAFPVPLDVRGNVQPELTSRSVRPLNSIEAQALHPSCMYGAQACALALPDTASEDALRAWGLKWANTFDQWGRTWKTFWTDVRVDDMLGLVGDVGRQLKADFKPRDRVLDRN